uniref:Uncharacterized protein n=1 Tax=Arundo donax TaxID=35708 RepID=A0A0A9E0Q1_ARUDO
MFQVKSSSLLYLWTDLFHDAGRQLHKSAWYTVWLSVCISVH